MALVTQQLLVIAEIWPDVRCAFAAKLGNNMPDRDYCFGLSDLRQPAGLDSYTPAARRKLPWRC
jgi:hypothetical protein